MFYKRALYKGGGVNNDYINNAYVVVWCGGGVVSDYVNNAYVAGYGGVVGSGIRGLYRGGLYKGGLWGVFYKGKGVYNGGL